MSVRSLGYGQRLRLHERQDGGGRLLCTLHGFPRRGWQKRRQCGHSNYGKEYEREKPRGRVDGMGPTE
jgi:hypothetical protein